jgi:hypothetical protein
MSGFGYYNPVAGRDKSNWDLAAVMKGLAGHVGSRSWTCSVNGTGIWQWTQISLDKLKKMSSPDMSGLGARHVRFRLLESGQTGGNV